MMRRRTRSALSILAPFLFLVSCTSCATPQPDAKSLAGRLLDDSAAEEARTALVRERVDDAADILTAMIDGMVPKTEEEYRRIPWLWRVSRAAGESNDAEVIEEVLNVAAPHDDEPLHDWQAVVLGGGIVSGLSAVGEWPRERIEAILEANPNLSSRFRRAVDLSAAMADDTSVPHPTRYDALRLVAVKGWDSGSPQLIRYLPHDAHAELQMGAVSGLADIRAPQVDSVLLDHFDGYVDHNRQVAIDALLRTDARASALLDAVEQGIVAPESLPHDRVLRLREHPSETIRGRAHRLLPSHGEK